MSGIEFFQNFGVPGLLLGGAWLFWNKWKRFAQVVAIAGVVLALANGISELVQRWPQSPQLVVSPSPSPRPWAGFYDDGSPVADVTAELVRNGIVLDFFSAPGFDIADHALSVQEIDNNWLRALWQGNPQGKLSSTVLEQAGFRCISPDAVPTPRWLAVSETADGTDRIEVRADAAKRAYFTGLAASIDRYAPENEGVVVSVYGDGTGIASSLISRADDAPEVQRRLQFTYRGETYGVMILFLAFQAPPEIANNSATLLFVRY